MADANKFLIEVPQGWLAEELRFYSDSAENTVDVVELYAASTYDSKPDHYRWFAQLTLTVGTQKYGSNLFHDTVVAISKWMTKKGAVSPANNTFGSYSLNNHGHSNILAIASALGSTTLFCDYKKV